MAVHWPPLRAHLAHVAPGRGGTACSTRPAGGRNGACWGWPPDHRPPLFSADAIEMAQ